jgi:hypothetical protein
LTISIKSIRGSALPSPKRPSCTEALDCQGTCWAKSFVQAGYAQAGLKLSHPACLLPARPKVLIGKSFTRRLPAPIFITEKGRPVYDNKLFLADGHTRGV